jgi:hypothetical protein
MKKASLILTLFSVVYSIMFMKTKISGIVVDKQNQPIPFYNVVLKDQEEGTRYEMKMVILFELKRRTPLCWFPQ